MEASARLIRGAPVAFRDSATLPPSCSVAGPSFRCRKRLAVSRTLCLVAHNAGRQSIVCNVASTTAPDDVSVDGIHATDSEPTARKATFAKAGAETRLAAALGTGAAMAFCIFSDELPAMRLSLMTYMLWATGEWVVHKYFMHAKKGSFGDRVSHLNTLHVVHHLDTNKDMTMRDGFERDALYFHFPNSVIQVIFGTSVLLGADVALDLSIPLWWTAVAAVSGMTIHNLLWNTMHMDMHEVPGDYEDGLPCIAYSRYGLLQPYVQWVFDNHTTHHDIGGSMNYNIICPGPDFLLGTYMHRSRSVSL